MRWLVILALAPAACDRREPPPPPPAPAPPARVTPRADPAHVAGSWDYTTTSNCGAEGVGWVRFDWTDDGHYHEEGQVSWMDEGALIRWWGNTTFDPTTRRLNGSLQNTLGDHVDGEWRLEGEGPARLVVDWTQTNGCTGTGIATRRLTTR